LAEPLRGMPYISVKDMETGREITNSILESHRINSPYILESSDKTFFRNLQEELGVLEKGRVDLKLLARILLKYDPNSLVHGVFLAKKDLAGGRLRLPRTLSSFIEAEDVVVAASGGVKFDIVDPGGETRKGFGHVPFSRDEYAARRIAVYFSIDLEQLRGFGLPPKAEEFLLNLMFFKILGFLNRGLRLRTACDLKVKTMPGALEPSGVPVPSLESIEMALPAMVESCSGYFADPPVSTVKYDLGH